MADQGSGRHTWPEQHEFEEALKQCHSISRSKIGLPTKLAVKHIKVEFAPVITIATFYFLRVINF